MEFIPEVSPAAFYHAGSEFAESGTKGNYQYGWRHCTGIFDNTVVERDSFVSSMTSIITSMALME